MREKSLPKTDQGHDGKEPLRMKHNLSIYEPYSFWTSRMVWMEVGALVLPPTPPLVFIDLYKSYIDSKTDFMVGTLPAYQLDIKLSVGYI